jgi:hypothetical protein
MGPRGKAQTPQQSTPPATAPQAGPSDIFDRVISNQKRTEQALDLFERTERIEIRKTGGDPNPFAVKILRVFPAGTGTDKITLSSDGKPASPDSYRAELEKLERHLAWAAERGPAQKEAYGKFERKRKERNDLLEATHEAFLFVLVGHELRGDRTLAKYRMDPNPAFKPTSRNSVLFTKVRGFIWIDEEASELAKIEGYVTEDISLALFLAKVYKGSHFMQERYEISAGIWLPSYQQYDFDGRKYLLPFSVHERSFYQNYKRVGPPKEALALIRGELGMEPGAKADP